MRRRTFVASATAAGLAAPFVAGAAEAGTIRFVPQTGLSNLDPIWTTIDVVRNASLLFWDTLYGVDSTLTPRPQMVSVRRAPPGISEVVPSVRTALRPG